MTTARALISCTKEARVHINAWKHNRNVWNNHQLGLPGGAYDEIIDGHPV